MKKIVVNVLIYVLGAVMLIGGTVFAAFMHNINTVDFDNYVVNYWTPSRNASLYSEEPELRNWEDRIKYPDFISGKLFVPELSGCYAEVDNAGKEYALKIAQKYHYKADLDFTVEHTGKLFTIKFTGTGYPEDGEPEDLSRTFIFDIEGAGADKLPRLVNRAEFIGY